MIRHPELDSQQCEPWIVGPWAGYSLCLSFVPETAVEAAVSTRNLAIAYDALAYNRDHQSDFLQWCWVTTTLKLSSLYQGAFISCSWACRGVWFGWPKLDCARLFCKRLQVRCPFLQVRGWFRSGSHASHPPWSTVTTISVQGRLTPCGSSCLHFAIDYV